MSGGSGRTAETAGVAETERLAAALGRAAAPGDVLGLVGDLGAGKTAFVRGLAGGLGIDPAAVASPTFTMIAEHRGRLPLNHVDLYRVEPGEADLWLLDEYVRGPGVTAIEWFDRLPAGALDAYLLVRIDYRETGRRLTFEPRGERPAAWLAALRST